jgi:molybdate transport system substrate-binding protein
MIPSDGVRMNRKWIAGTILTFGLGSFLTGSSLGESLRVFAAASLTDAFVEMGESFEAAHPGLRVEFNFAGSQVLRTQIEQGAQADVFVSADRLHADELLEQGLLGATSILARNVLVVVTPAEAARVKALADLANPGTKIVVAGPTVPVGRYTTQVLGNLAASGLYGEDYRSRTLANVVSQESNVRAVLAKIALGEADAGFVYRTDAMMAPAKVQLLDIPERLNVVAEYPVGIVTAARSPRLARRFVDLALGADGQSILHKHGFTQ